MPKGIPENPDPFGGIAGNRVELSGDINCAQSCPGVDLDIFVPDEQSPWSKDAWKKMKLQNGPYVIMVPENFGLLILEAFVDFDANGPGIADLMGVYEGNPIRIADSSVSNIDLNLAVSSDGKMPDATPWTTVGTHPCSCGVCSLWLGSRRIGWGIQSPMSLQELNQPWNVHIDHQFWIQPVVYSKNECPLYLFRMFCYSCSSLFTID